MKEIPAAIEMLAGREAEIAHRLVPEATLRVSFFGPIPNLSPKCYFLQRPYTDHKKKISIQYIQDTNRNGHELHCLCTEDV